MCIFMTLSILCWYNFEVILNVGIGFKRFVEQNRITEFELNVWNKHNSHINKPQYLFQPVSLNETLNLGTKPL